MRNKLIRWVGLLLFVAMLLLFTSCHDSGRQKATSNTNEGKAEIRMEINKRILLETLASSENNARNMARGFSDLEITIKEMEIEEKTERNGLLVGYVVRVEDDANNIYYLLTDQYCWMYEIRKDDRNGKLIYISGDDIASPLS